MAWPTQLSLVRDVPYMGVIRVLEDAAELGYRADHPNWRNLGQGQPEVGPLPGAPDRVDAVHVDPHDHAYGPVAGVEVLRQAVAEYYNATYRARRTSQYTAENVAITPGGRAGLARVFTALEPHAVGCFSPDYPAYVDLFRFLGVATARPVDLTAETGFALSADTVEDHVREGALSLLLLSNPCNPTGRVIAGRELADLIDVGRRTGCGILVDEYYSHYVYDDSGPVSGAAHVEEVDDDPVVLFDGLTKNFRYPGWRIGWVVGPKPVIDTIISVGSFLDGGASRFVQRAAVDLLRPEAARRETEAVRAAFEFKRDLVVERLPAIGLRLPRVPDGTFYAFASVEALPPPLDTGQGFFQAALQQCVITVPGEYFDMARGVRHVTSPGYEQFVRISFGSPRHEVEEGLTRLEHMVRNHGG